MTTTPATDQTAAQPLDLDAIAARAATATPGPWTAHDDGLVWADRIGDPVSGSVEQADAAFIAAARTDVERLLAEVRELRTRLGAAGMLADAVRTWAQDLEDTGPTALLAAPHAALYDEWERHRVLTLALDNADGSHTLADLTRDSIDMGTYDMPAPADGGEGK